MRKALQAVMPDRHVTVRPLGDIANAQASWRMGDDVHGVRGLALVGGGRVARVIGYSVAQRGMSWASALHSVPSGGHPLAGLGQSVRFALAGTALGLIVALAQSRWIQPLLFHQSATDPWILAGVAGAMLVVAVAAGAAPAWRAARADPNAALRAE